MSSCKACCGVEHHLMVRALFNDGTEYEREKKNDKAYQRYRDAYLLSKHIWGSGHSETTDYLNVLKESKYADIAKKKKESFESMVFDPDKFAL